MEVLQLVIPAIGILLLLHGVRSLREIGRVRAIVRGASDMKSATDFKMSYSYRLLQYPDNVRNARGGLGGFGGTHPMLMFLLVVLVLGLFAVIVLSSLGNPLAVTAIAGLAISLAFFSGPYRINVLEYYTARMLTAPAAQLSAYDAHAARVITGPLQTWNQAKVIFALSLLVAVMLPPEMLLVYLLLMVLVAFIALGTYYSLGRGIFAEPARDSARPDEQWVERLLSEIVRTE